MDYSIPTSIPTGQYKVKVLCWRQNSEGSDCNASDISDNYFTITSGTSFTLVSAPVINITINGSAYNGSTATTTFGGTANIGWGVTPTSGTTCAAAGNGIDGGADAVNLSGTWTPPALYTSTTYGIRCTNSLGTTYKYVSIGVQTQTSTTVAGNPSPVIKLNESNDSSRLNLNVEFGRTATFTWSVTQPAGTVTTCYAAGNGVNGATGSGAVALSGGPWTTPALYANTTYGVACSNTNSSGVTSGTTYKYADVIIATQTNTTIPTTASISASPSSVPAGES
ncbi:MAG: hypothetical protein AAB899_03870, partial [Patescibacteria group bacterium]